MCAMTFTPIQPKGIRAANPYRSCSNICRPVLMHPGDLTYRAASDLNGEELEELAALTAEHGKVTAPLIVVRE